MEAREVLPGIDDSITVTATREEWSEVYHQVWNWVPDHDGSTANFLSLLNRLGIDI